MTNPKFEKLKTLLMELFQLDQPDLDFGLYRIMHAKSDEITQFLEKDLLPQVRDAFGEYRSADKAELEKQIEQATKQAEKLGFDPSQSPQVRELQAQYNATAVDVEALESEVYDHLYSFFRRYYHEGDFLAKRVYKPGVYAIPYEGEEVKLHWANKDQYYIKTSEYLRDYAFKLRPDEQKNPMRVHFRLVDAAEGQHGNVKESNGGRVFILASGDFMVEEDGEASKELVLRFEYRPANIDDWTDAAKEKATAASSKKPPAQNELIAIAVQRILDLAEHQTLNTERWRAALAEPHVKRNGETAGYSRIEAHLRRYTARNTFDYFIHKDLGGFLRRELDFYIKNEVMHLDDIENDTSPRVEQYLSKIKIIRHIAGKVIDFLAQLEDFQKKLWLKKKFVTETSWCIRVGCIPKEFYPEIARNAAQIHEWIRLHRIDSLVGDLAVIGYSQPLTVEFLDAYPTLMIDTTHFSRDFTDRLLDSIDSISGVNDAVVFHSENAQVLSLIRSTYEGKIRCVYIDPPYNTDASPIAYKNGYRRSSWIALVAERLRSDNYLRCEPSLRCIAIDDFEYADLAGVLEALSPEIHHATAVVRSKPQGRPTATGFSANHEYAVFWGHKDATVGRLPRSGSKAERYPHVDSRGIYAWSNFRKSGTDSDRSDRPRSYYPLYVCDENARVPQMTWDAHNEVWEVQEEPRSGDVEVWPNDASGLQKVWTCSPERVARELDDMRVLRNESGGIEIQKKYRPNQEGSLPGTWWQDKEYSASESGTKILKDMFGAKDFDYPKSIYVVRDCLRVLNLGPDDVVLDYFAGSGTTGHAVISLNRDDGGKRKFILVEMGDYFDTVLLPRLKKVTFTPEWKAGKPKRLATVEEVDRSPCIVKVVRLESYEDALNNLDLRRGNAQQSLLSAPEAQGEDGLREQYILRYMLDVETRGSQSLLNVAAFTDPTAYTLKVRRPGSDESREVNVELLETFNWLIGLTVEHIAAPQTFDAAFDRDTEGRLQLKDRIKQVDSGLFWFRTVTGATPDGRKTLVIWRKLPRTIQMGPDGAEYDNLVLDTWFVKQGYSSKDSEFDLIYVNGDNNLENLRKPDDTWKVRLIEEDFHRLMFDTENV